MELLIIKKRLDDLYELQDSKGFHIATYKTPEEAEQWAKENGYRTKRQFVTH